jgi:hypothetical protein
MRTAARAPHSFSLDREILAEIKRTRGALSQNERANRLLRLALDSERRAFECAAMESLARD